MKYEIIGLIGTCFIVLCFTFDDQKKIRIFDGIGSLFFVAYGILIGALSNVVLNGILICIHCYKLYKMRRAGEENGKAAEGN